MHLSSYDFTTTQLLKLVSNAEGLLQKLADTHIPAEYQCEINEWLCLKQECEEVLSTVASNSAEEDDENVDDSDASSSVKSEKEKEKRGLGPIAEVTENEESISSFSESSGSERNRSVDYGCHQKFEKPPVVQNNSDFCNNNNNNTNNYSNDHNNTNSGNHSLVIDPEQSELNFTDMFDKFYCKFRQITESKIRHEKNPPDDKPLPKSIGNIKLSRKSICALEDPLRNPDYVSISDKKKASPEPVEEISLADREDDCIARTTSAMNSNLCVESKLGTNKNEVTDVVPVPDSRAIYRDSLGIVDPVKELQYIVSYNESKKNTICLMYIDINEAKKRLLEFQKVVKLKEELLQKLMKNADPSVLVQRKTEMKLSRLEADCSKIKSRLAKHEKNLILNNERVNMNDMAKYKNLLIARENKLNDMKIIYKIARDNSKNIVELERSLHFSKKKMQKLAKSLKLEDRNEVSNERREALLHEDAKTKLNRLLLEQLLKQNSDNLDKKAKVQSQLQQAEKEYQSHILKSLGVIKEASNSFKKSKEDSANFSINKCENLSQEGHRSKTDACSLRGLTESCKSDSHKDDKSGAKLTFEDGDLKGIKELCWRITQLENVVRENTCATESANVSKSKEVLRHEIRNLRRTKECLLEERDKLSCKIKSKSSSSSEKRMFYEVDESIDAVDNVIEYKNELLCGRSGLELKDKDALKFEIMLLARLSNLSPDEMRSLLYRYFWKVVDLRESSKSLEEQITDMDVQFENIAMKFQRLVNDIQYNDVLSELKLTLMQKDYEEKIGSLLRHFCDPEGNEAEEVETNYNFENALVPQDPDTLDTYVVPSQWKSLRSGIPSQILHHVHANSSQTSTKVCRQKNKLIFVQEKKKSN